MAGQNEFLQALQELVCLGESNEGRLTLSMIENYFEDMKLEKGQIDSICRYLQSQKIVIEQWIASGEEENIQEEIVTAEDPLDHSMVDIYIKETTTADTVSPEQESALLGRLATGDAEARHLLIESWLGRVVEIAKNYKNKGMQMSDLIQEGNIALMIAVSDYDDSVSQSFPVYIEEAIRKHIEQTLEEYNGSTRSAIKMANLINELNDLATAFAKENGREAQPEELAEKMGITAEEVKDLMKVSLDAITVIE